MTPNEIQSLLDSSLSGAVTGAQLEAIDPWLEIDPARLIEVATLLRNDERTRFDYLNCISGVDYTKPDAKERRGTKGDWPIHLEVVYHLTSLVHKHRIVLKLMLPRWKDDVPGRLPEVASVHTIWGTAEWHEREVYDLMGVHFTGHPDMRRILCPDDWVGHPLRKDYQMPLEYHGIRSR